MPIDESNETAPSDTMPGGILSLSSNHQQTGSVILWVSIPRGGEGEGQEGHTILTGLLRAYDASDLKKKLWEQQLDQKRYVKFVPPTIANGKVYMAGIGKVAVFGAGPPTNCFVTTLDCESSAIMGCDPTPTTLILQARRANMNPPAEWSPVDFTQGTPSALALSVSGPTPGGPGIGLVYDFRACAGGTLPEQCVAPVPQGVPDPTGCPGGPPPPPPPSRRQCINEGCDPSPRGGCICQ
jgi:hypothetical protein